MHRLTCRRAILAALALALPPIALAQPEEGKASAEAGAKRLGTISGKLRGSGDWASSPGERIATVQAIGAEKAKVADGARLTDSLRYRLKVPEGFYVVLGEASDLGAGRDHAGNSHVIEATAGKNTRQDLKLKPLPARAAASQASPGGRPRVIVSRATGAEGSAKAAGRRGRTKVVTVSPKVRISDPETDYRIPIQGPLETDLTALPCPGETRLTLVLHPSQRDVLLDEIRLSNSRFADPGTRLKARFIEPRFEVKGGGQISGGTVAAQLTIVDRKTGRVVGEVSASGPEQSFFDVLAELGRKLVDELCRELPDSYSGPFSGSFVNSEFTTSWNGTASFERVDRPECEEAGHACYDLVSGTVTWEVSTTPGAFCSYQAAPKTTTLQPGQGALVVKLPSEGGDAPGYSGGFSVDDSNQGTVDCGDGAGPTIYLPLDCCWSTGDGVSADDQTALENGWRLQGTHTRQTGDGTDTYSWDFAGR